MKNYYESNKEEILKYKKEYWQKNKEKESKRNKEYYENNKKEIHQKGKEYMKERRNNNPLIKLKEYLRSLIYHSIKNQGYTKRSKTEKILGCSFDEFKIYFEPQFKEGMSWENQGKWHLDHIKPVSWAKTEEEVYELNHYTNFQPL